LADIRAHAKAHDRMQPDGNLKWDELDARWWKTIPAFDGAGEFYDEMRKLGQARFLSAPLTDPASFTGKAQWIMGFRMNKFALKDIVTCRGKDKHLLASGGHVLIDDNEDHVKEW